MKETWRWYGPLDQIQLTEIRQTGAAGIVTALHEIPYGEVWQRNTIAERRDEIRAAGFEWDVVESLPLHEDIKRGMKPLQRPSATKVSRSLLKPCGAKRSQRLWTRRQTRT